MVEVTLRPRAQRDFLEIGEYTRDQWSEQQAEAYLQQLLDLIAQIGEHPMLGREVAEARGYRRRRTGAHIVFYRIKGVDSVEIIRILHEKSDVLRHLRFDG